VTYQTKRLKLGSLVSASHCTSVTTFHDNYAMKLIAQMADAGLNVVVSPMTSATCLKVMTRVAEMWDAGINIAFAQDCVMDPWYAFGKEDMLEVAHMAIHFGRLLSEKRKRQVFDGITFGGAKALGLEGYGLERGCRADMVVLQASTPMEAVRLKAARLAVIRAGRVVASSEPRVSTVTLDNAIRVVDFSAESVMH
jgi:cytosine deaminase